MEACKLPRWTLLALTLPLMAAALLALLWLFQAHIAKKEVAAFISRLNGQNEMISYKSITTEGFPSALVVRIHQPVVKFPLQKTLKPLGEQMPSAADGTDQAEIRKILLALPEWEETIKLDGDIAFSVNAASDHYQLKPLGKYQIESMINGRTLRYEIAMDEGARGCQINFASRPLLGLWRWDYLLGDSTKAADALQKLECHIPSLRLFINHASKPSYTSEPTVFLYENQGQGDMLNIKIQFENAEYMASDAFDELTVHYYHAAYPEQALPQHYRMAPLGKQHVHANAHMSFHKTMPKSAPMTIVMDDFTYRSEISDWQNSLSITSEALDKGGKLSWNLKSNTSFKEAAYRNYLSQAAEYASSMYRNLKATGNAFAQLDEAGFVSQYQSLVPKIHEFGIIQIAFAGNGVFKDSVSMPVELEALAVNVNAYGIEAKGKGEVPTLSPLPTGEYYLACRSCLLLVDDLAAWFQRLQPLLKEAEATNYWANLPLTPEVIAGVKQFLQKLDPSGTDVLHYTITLDPAGNMAINHKPMEAIEQLYHEEVGRLLNASADSYSPTPLSPTFKAVPVQPVTTTAPTPPTL